MRPRPDGETFWERWLAPICVGLVVAVFFALGFALGAQP